MRQDNLLKRIFPDSPVPPHVVEPTKDGLLLSGGSALHWPDEETGVVLLFDNEGELENEWWENDDGYSDLMELFMDFPGPRDIQQQRPRLRVVRFEDDEESPE